MIEFHKTTEEEKYATLSVWPALVVNAAVSFAVPNLIYFAVYGRAPLFRESVSQLKRVLLKRSGRA